MRNPKWHRDEIILALDLYFDEERGSIDARNPKVIELSKILNSLPFQTAKLQAENFRNPNGVSLKLSNFLAIDPEYQGKGMKQFSKLDEEVFFEFQNDRTRLKEIAAKIKTILQDKNLQAQISLIEDDEETRNDSVIEGQILYRLHKFRERDKKLVSKKKAQALLRSGKLNCEACNFDFEEFYGVTGSGYIECHHKTPLSMFKVERKTTLDDLALICSNCHRMLHRSINILTIEELKGQIAEKSTS
jgi:5-methylcytosine-specific restriction protein A